MKTPSIALVNTRPKKTLDDELIPMINIVFLLLIFFMVAGQIEQQNAKAVTVPESSITLPHINNVQAFSIDFTGGISWKGSVLDISSLNSVLQSDVPKNSTIEVRADRDLTAKQLDPFLKLIKANGFQKIRFITISSGDQ